MSDKKVFKRILSPSDSCGPLYQPLKYFPFISGKRIYLRYHSYFTAFAHCNMGNWRIYQSYILISAFVFKILILGTVLTLASHNICLDQLLDGEIKWSQLVGKKRKRNDESSHNTPVNTVEAVSEPEGDIVAKTLLTLPCILLLRWILSSSIPKNRHLFYLISRYTVGKIFIKHCSLIR